MPPVNPERLPALMQEAQQLLVSGKYARARARLEAVLSTRPDLAVAHFNMAKVLLKLSEPDAALVHLERAADLKPDEAVIWQQYAKVLQWKGDPAKSDAFLEKAKRARLERKLLISLQDMLRPKSARSKTTVGDASPADIQRAIAHVKAGRFEDAAKLADQLDRAHPDVAIIVDLLAYAQAEIGQHQDAERNFRRAVGIDPKYAETRANFAQFLLRQGRLDEAAEMAKEALRLVPDMPAALVTLGTALNRKALHAQAIPFLQRALVLSPDQAAPKIELAECLLAVFKPLQALDVLEPIRHLEMPNANIQVLFARALAALERNEEAEAEFDKALDKAKVKTLAQAGKAELLQVLGRFEEAETLLRSAIESDPMEGRIYHQLVMTRKLKPGDPIIARMEATYHDPAIADDSKMHLGFALSKALEDVGEYDRVFAYLRPANDQMRREFPYDLDRYRRWLDFLFDAFASADFNTPIRGASEFDPIFVTGLPRSGTTLVEQIIASHSKVTGGGELSHAYGALNEAMAGLQKRGVREFSLPDEQLAGIAQDIETRMRDTYPLADRITDKGLRTHEMIGPIRAIFPRARIVVVQRDPRDTLLSMYKNVFGDGRHRYSNSLSDLAASYHSFVEIIDFWRKKLPGSFHEIGYEALIADPEAEARKLIAACGLEWEDQCLAFHENKRRVQTLSVHQVRQPLYASSMKAWQRYEKDLGELFEALGDPWKPGGEG